MNKSDLERIKREYVALDESIGRLDIKRQRLQETIHAMRSAKSILQQRIRDNTPPPRGGARKGR